MILRIYYLAQTASAKSSQVWGKVLGAPTKASWPGIFDLAYLFVESMTPTISYQSDEFPKAAWYESQRAKPIHSVGVIAQCKFTWNQEVIKSLGTFHCIYIYIYMHVTFFKC